MFGAIAKMILRAKIREENSKRQKKFLPWDHIEKMALIIERQDALNKSLIDTFIDETKKHVEVFYIETRSKVHTYSDWHCFTKKDRSFWNLPSRQAESALKTKRFDAVINTCSETNLFALSLSSAIPAQLKCGEHESFDLADLIIKKKEPFHLKSYLDDTVRYLKMIKA